MKPVAPVLILAVLAGGCAHSSEVQSAAACSPCDTTYAPVVWGPGTTGRVDAATAPTVELPSVDVTNDGMADVTLDADGDGRVALDLPTCSADLSALDPNGDRRIDVALVQGAAPTSAGGATAGVSTADLDATQAAMMCPADLDDLAVAVDCTCRGVEVTFTTDDADEVLLLRQLGARLAMEHTVAHDGVPVMEPQMVTLRGRTADGKPFVLTDEVAFDDVRHRTHATVVGVPDGVRIMFEPRSEADIGAVQGMGQRFGAQLAATCDIEV